MHQTWRYHAHHAPKMVDMDDHETLERLHAEGWRDTPAAFDDASVEPEAGLGEIEQALLATFEHDPYKLTKDEHVDLGKALGLKLDKRSKEATLIARIQEHLDGNDQAAD